MKCRTDNNNKMGPNYANNLSLTKTTTSSFKLNIVICYFPLLAQLLSQYKIDAKSSLLDMAAFRLEARIRSYGTEENIIIYKNIIVNELYSNNELRAKLEIGGAKDDEQSFVSSQNAIKHYYDGSTEKSRWIKTSNSSAANNWTECELGDANKLVADLFGSETRFLTGEDWLTEKYNEAVPDYFIGLARLLFVVDENKDKLELISDLTTYVRQNQADMYRLKIDNNYNNNNLFNLTVFYRKTTTQLSPFAVDNFPLRVSLSLPDHAVITIDYFSIRPILDEQNSDQDHIHGLFTFPIGRGCSERLQPTDLLNGSKEAPKVVSFRAKVMELWYNKSPTPIGNYFIAYDGHVGMLRTDLIRSGKKSYVVAGQVEQEDEEEYSISIYDLKVGRKYNIREPMKVVSSAVEFRETSQCVSATLFNDVQNPYEPVIPFDKLVHMGTAIVRGANVEVFERVSMMLPIILFPHGNVVDPTAGKNRSIYMESFGGENETTGGAYTIVYYFSTLTSPTSDGDTMKVFTESFLSIKHGQQQHGPLMRIDVMRETRLYYRVDIQEFGWQLAEAPNGDRQDQLFSLGDRCSSGAKRGQHAVIKMELEYDDNTVGGLPVPTAFALIQGPLARNKALVRAMGDSIIIRATQIYEIESRINGRQLVEFNSQKLKLHLAARLSNPTEEVQVYEALLIGSAMLHYVEQTTLAPNFDECFWDAVHRHRRAHRRDDILFSFCFNYCLIDELQHQRGSREEVPKSSMFVIAKDINQMPCLVSRVNMRENGAVKSGSNWGSKYSSELQNKMKLRLPLIDHSGSHLESLEFQVKRFELTTDSNSSTSLDQEETLKGLGLLTTGDSNKVVVATPPMVMNYGLCHSSCMANMSCNSFSVCITGQQVECITSDFEFRNSDLLAKIRTQVDELTTKGKRIGKTVFSVEERAPNRGSEREEDNNERQQIDLKMDYRCRIYHKYALEMFRFSSEVLTKLQGRPLIGVDNEEECAEICLGKNVKFFKRAAKVKLHTLRETGGVDHEEKILSQLNDSMRSWCASFGFLSLSSITSGSTLPEAARAIIEQQVANKGGLCVLVRPQWAQSQKRPQSTVDTAPLGGAYKVNDKQMPAMKFHKYDFVYSMLYEKHYRVKLLSSKSDGKGGNNQVVVQVQNNDVEWCARACFSQTVQLKPWCKSFDFFEDRSQIGDENRDQLKKYCIFNSITLAEARKLHTTTENSTDNIDVWHYEPRDSYTLDSVVAARLLRDNKNSNNNQPVGYFRLFTILVVLMLSLTTSMVSSVRLSNFISKQMANGRRESVTNPSLSFLNSLRIGGESSNSDISHRRFELDFDDLPDITGQPYREDSSSSF